MVCSPAFLDLRPSELENYASANCALEEKRTSIIQTNLQGSSRQGDPDTIQHVDTPSNALNNVASAENDNNIGVSDNQIPIGRQARVDTEADIGLNRVEQLPVSPNYSSVASTIDQHGAGVHPPLRRRTRELGDVG